MGGIAAKLTTWCNEAIFPLGLRLTQGALLLEIPPRYAELLGDMAESVPDTRCACGSDKVLNYGIPKNNGRYFYCRRCMTAFKAPIFQREWNELYRACGRENPAYDFWLEKYRDLLGASHGEPIMDLGAGYGNDTLYLRQQGFNPLCCDYSAEALRRLKGMMAPAANAVCFDMLDGLPFPASTFKVIVANLSLHYFSWHDTERVIKEIRRVLSENGCLLCRVNSTRDKEHGAGTGTRIEENYFDVGGKRKRFFNERQLRALFRGWEILACFEHRLLRFGRTKLFWEVVVRKQ